MNKVTQSNVANFNFKSVAVEGGNQHG